MIKKIYVVYFSPTYTSRKNALSIAQQFSSDIQEVDLTLVRNKVILSEFNNDDVVIFAAPVYGGRLYKGFVERLKMIKGDNTPCIVTVTYGNRDYDDALIEMYDVVMTLGFIPFAGAAMIGEHTYGKIATARPDDDDIIKNKEFASKAYEKYVTGDYTLTVKGNRPYRDGGDGSKLNPVTDKGKCIKCGWCYENCPEDAIDCNDYSVIDSNKCIGCFRCLKNCPVNAKQMIDEGYIAFAKKFTEDLKEPRQNEYFL